MYGSVQSKHASMMNVNINVNEHEYWNELYTVKQRGRTKCNLILNFRFRM